MLKLHLKKLRLADSLAVKEEYERQRKKGKRYEPEDRVAPTYPQGVEHGAASQR